MGRTWLEHRDFSDLREEVNRENREALHMFAVAGNPLGLINFTAQQVVVGTVRMESLGLLPVAYSLLLLAAEHWLIPEEYPHSTLALYLAQAPILLLAVMLGTVWDPNHQAMTILLCLLVMPVFLMDRPLRIALWLGFWSAFFAAACICGSGRV